MSRTELLLPFEESAERATKSPLPPSMLFMRPHMPDLGPHSMKSLAPSLYIASISSEKRTGFASCEESRSLSEPSSYAFPVKFE